MKDLNSSNPEVAEIMIYTLSARCLIELDGTQVVDSSKHTIDLDQEGTIFNRLHVECSKNAMTICSIPILRQRVTAGVDPVHRCRAPCPMKIFGLSCWRPTTSKTEDKTNCQDTHGLVAKSRNRIHQDEVSVRYVTTPLSSYWEQQS